VDQDKTFSRPGTARALVLLASGLALAGAALVLLLALVLGPGLVGRQGLTGSLVGGTAAFGGFVLVSAVVANVLAARAKSLRGVVGVGCGTLVVGVAIGLGVMLSLLSRAG
jgi:hypothetical protein